MVSSGWSLCGRWRGRCYLRAAQITEVRWDKSLLQICFVVVACVPEAAPPGTWSRQRQRPGVMLRVRSWWGAPCSPLAPCLPSALLALASSTTSWEHIPQPAAQPKGLRRKGVVPLPPQAAFLCARFPTVAVVLPAQQLFNPEGSLLLRTFRYEHGDTSSATCS